MSRIFWALIVGLASVIAAAAAPNNVVGHTYYLNGDPLANVTVTITTIEGSVVATSVSKSDGQIKYAFIPDGTYIATPTSPACSSFEPATRTFTVLNNQPQIDFVGHCVVGGITLISPPNGAADIPILPTLSWSAPGATNFEVYLGTATTPPYVANTAVEQFTPSSSLTGGTTYSWQVKATNAEGAWVTSPIWTFTTAASAIPPGYRFVPVTPCRVLDTRADYGMTGDFGPPALAANTPRTIPVPSSACGIPPTAKGYSINATAVPQGTLGYLSFWPAGTDTAPVVSTLNSIDGRIVANAAIVPAGVNGAINVLATDPTDFIIDINGYFDDQAGTLGLWFYPTTPCRVADTREASKYGPTFGSPALETWVERSFVMPNSVCSLPAAPAYSLNFTVVPPGFLGYLSVWPTGQTQPVVSTLNSYEGAVVANAAIVPAGPGGSIQTLVTHPTELVIDSNGYFGAQTTNGVSYFPVTPCRAVDTREAAGDFGGPALTASATRDFPIASGRCGVPTTAKGIVANITVVPRGFLGYVTVWPSGIAQPVVSTLNSYEGRIVSNAALVPVGTNGAVSLFATHDTDVIIDVAGYFN